MWKHEIDHLIHVLQDGGNRIHCAELRGENPLLLISVYMPCRGLSDNVEYYNDCLDQLREILLKFSCSHTILLGGDMNEDMILRDQTIRAQLLKSFVKDNLLETINTCQTYCNPDGVLISTLDYIFYSKDLTEKVVQHKGLENLQTCVSDHIPVFCQIRYDLDKVTNTASSANLKPPSNIRWKKLDKDLYNSLLSSALQEVDTSVDTVGTLNNSVMKLNDVLDTCAKAAAPSKERRPRKAKLRTWTPEIMSTVGAKKKAFFDWKATGRPDDKEHHTVINKKNTTILLRQLCRREISHKTLEERHVIMDSRSNNMALFHKLVNKQRGKLSSFINELHVGGDVLRGNKDILTGWHQHFNQLATPTQETDFDTDYKKTY